MRVLFCSLKYSYGNPALGLSHEYINLYDSLLHMKGVESQFFAIDERMQVLGRDAMNEELIDLVLDKKPDLLFCQLFTEELKKETIAYITHKTKTKTLNWFGDDHWRFHLFSKQWAPLFSAVATTDSTVLPLYKKLGVEAHLTQWAVNQYRYTPTQSRHSSELSSCASFVGQRYGVRSRYFSALQKAQLPVCFYGSGWPYGPVNFERMVEIFSSSSVNLNFTESPHGEWSARLKLLGKFFVRKEFGKIKNNVHNFFNMARALPGFQQAQIKGRIFEVLGCGGFLLTGRAADLDRYYKLGTELVVFTSADDLVEKVKYYLSHPHERKSIALAGYERTLAEHTYEHRFVKLFRALGFNF